MQVSKRMENWYFSSFAIHVVLFNLIFNKYFVQTNIPDLVAELFRSQLSQVLLFFPV